MFLILCLVLLLFQDYNGLCCLTEIWIFYHEIVIFFCYLRTYAIFFKLYFFRLYRFLSMNSLYFYFKSQCRFYWSTYISPKDIFLMINGFTFVLIVTFWEIHFVESCNVSLLVSFIFHDLWKIYVCRILSIKHIYSLGMSH